jgi:hypothetical protein
MDRPAHYVRPDDEPPPPALSWWRRLYGHFHHFMFEKQPGYVPPYHANGHGATIADPRYPEMFIEGRGVLDNPEAERITTDEND